MPRNEWIDFLTSQLWSIPYGLACMVGLVTSVVYLFKHPAPALFALAAFAIILLSICGGVGVQFWMTILRGHEADSETIMRVFQISGILRSILSAGALCLLTIAVFIGRRTQSPFATPR